MEGKIQKNHTVEILLLRHGATDWNLQGRCQGATDLELNGTGLRQARETAASLSEETIHAVYSSHLKRAAQTAQLVSKPHHLAVTIDEDFRELHHGMLEGLTFSEIRDKYPDFISKWREEPAELVIPGGERLIDVYQRAWDGLKRIVERHQPGEKVIIVSHNFPILAILCRITGTHLNHYRTFRLDPCGINRIRYHNHNGWKVTHINNKDFAS